MTKDRLAQIFDASSNGIMRPEQAAILLPEVCELALELLKTVEQQNVQLNVSKRARPATYDPTQ